MDSFLDFTFLLPKNEGLKVPSTEPLDIPPGPSFDIPVDTERQGGGLSHAMCIIS